MILEVQAPGREKKSNMVKHQTHNAEQEKEHALWSLHSYVLGTSQPCFQFFLGITHPHSSMLGKQRKGWKQSITPLNISAFNPCVNE